MLRPFNIQTFLFSVFIFVFFSVPAHATVKGISDGIRKVGNNYFLVGWACNENDETSLPLEIYVGGPKGQGTLLKTDIANKPSEAAIGHICHTSKTFHRFRVPVSFEELDQYRGQSLYVYAQPSSHALVKSGQITVPELDFNIKGNIEFADFKNGQFTISGWACQNNIPEVVNVHIYIGAPAGQGEFYGSFSANKLIRPGVSKLCNTQQLPHQFSVELSALDLVNFKNKSIYIHGIRKFGKYSNLLLNKSGQYVIPEIQPKFIKLSELAIPGKDLSIKKGEIVEIDKSIDIKLLKIEGELHCPQN
ncbi:MAG: hypothetical protein KDD40_12920, partial [Bdellovibrionales bacterium]|nr:hypothetical protein [Bdellovibrionales bacterium]